MNETLLHIAWAHRLYCHIESVYALEIVDPGTYNEHAGPDFQNAKIKIDGILWAGNVELHLTAKHWYDHRHHEDHAYNSVILHLVFERDDVVCDSRGRCIPSGRLILPDDLIVQAEQLSCQMNYCHGFDWLREYLSQMDYKGWLSRLVLERLEERSRYWLGLLERNNGDSVEVFHQLLLRYFGFGLNNDAMERLARSIPARALIKQSDSVLQLEAMLLGQAGMLAHLPREHSYVELLYREYDFLASKYKLVPIDSTAFRWARTRPQSFPLRRLVQLAHLLHHTQFLSDKMLRVQTKDDLFRLLSYPTQGEFWRVYFGGGLENQLLTLSTEACLILGLNVATIYQFIMSAYRTDLAYLRVQALKLLESLPVEKNSIIRRMRQIGFTVESAAESQALLQLYHKYCQQRKCLYCPLGRAALIRSSLR